MGVILALVMAALPGVGDVAPDFTAKDTGGVTRHLDEMVQHGPVILAFFPKAFTGGCTKEISTYRDRYADIQKGEGQVLAVSEDSEETLTRFKDSLKAPFAFLSDHDAALAKAYGVKMALLPIAKRYTFVIGAGRKVLHVESGDDAIATRGAVAACPMRKQPAASPAPAPK